MDASLIVLSNQRKDEHLEASVDKALEVEEEHLKIPLKCEVAALRCASNTFLSKSITSEEVFTVENSIL